MRNYNSLPLLVVGLCLLLSLLWQANGEISVTRTTSGRMPPRVHLTDATEKALGEALKALKLENAPPQAKLCLYPLNVETDDDLYLVCPNTVYIASKPDFLFTADAKPIFEAIMGGEKGKTPTKEETEAAKKGIDNLMKKLTEAAGKFAKSLETTATTTVAKVNPKRTEQEPKGAMRFRQMAKTLAHEKEDPPGPVFKGRYDPDFPGNVLANPRAGSLPVGAGPRNCYAYALLSRVWGAPGCYSDTPLMSRIGVALPVAPVWAPAVPNAFGLGLAFRTPAVPIGNAGIPVAPASPLPNTWMNEWLNPAGDPTLAPLDPAGRVFPNDAANYNNPCVQLNNAMIADGLVNNWQAGYHRVSVYAHILAIYSLTVYGPVLSLAATQEEARFNNQGFIRMYTDAGKTFYGFKDYHFHRQDASGMWSDKNGDTFVNEVPFGPDEDAIRHENDINNVNANVIPPGDMFIFWSQKCSIMYAPPKLLEKKFFHPVANSFNCY